MARTFEDFIRTEDMDMILKRVTMIIVRRQNIYQKEQKHIQKTTMIS
jgi:hypothetical protein